MKLRVIDRLISAVIGILLLAMAVIVLTEMVFSDRLLVILGGWAAGKTGYQLAELIAAALIMALAGALSIHLAVRRTKRKGFVVQSTDVGELSISIRAIDNLVQRCVEKHEELHVTSTTLDNTRDGLVISMRIGLANGVNIPLAVTALQKQIKQYVTACSGVDVHEVKVQVDTTTAKGKPSIYAVSDILENPAPLPREEEQVPEISAEPVAEEAAVEKEEKCLHQRLFGEEEQPAIVPMPPEMKEAAEETADAEEAVEVADEAVTEEAQEGIQAEEMVEAVEEVAEAAEAKLPAEEIVEAWEMAEEEAKEAAEAEGLSSLAGLTGEESEDVAEEIAEAEEYDEADDEEAIAELAALDGAEESELEAMEAEPEEETEAVAEESPARAVAETEDAE